MTAKILTQDRLKQRLQYNPDTGIFRSIECLPYIKDKQVGARHGKGYLTYLIDGKNYYLHRLAWLYMTGEFPEQIDHINRVKDDNRWLNLRNVSNGVNHRNMPMHGSNKSGITGVHWSKQSKKWCAQITFRGNTYTLGLYVEIKDATKAREKAEQKFGFHPSHGRLS